jgi:hypothetical protein
MTKSWKAEVIADSSGKWSGNQMRFETKAETEAYARNLMARWTLVLEWRVVESDDPPSYRWVDGSLLPYSKLAQAMLLDEQKGGRL